MNATIKLEKKHFPVLLDELISIISPLYGGTFIDCTFGQGGYSKKILEHKKNKVIAIDRDEDSHHKAKELKKIFGNRFDFYNITFKEIDKISKLDSNLKAIIFDLGFSLNQITNLSKGLSFNSTGKLNMMMGKNDFSAHEVVNHLEEENLKKIFKIFGNESKSSLIAKKIIQERKKKLIGTEDLVKIIDDVKRRNKSKIHNATKVFQAIRIFVNQEISQLIYGLINSFKILPKGGLIIVVTFNSLEDKIVKYFFKNFSEEKKTSRYIPENLKNQIVFKLINKKPLIPNEKEINKNPPSRSAKLRYAIKINNQINFDDFLKKFNHLLNVEKIFKKL